MGIFDTNRSLTIKCVPASSFLSQRIPTISFSFHSLHLPHLLIFSNSLYKSLLPLSHSLTIWSSSSSSILTSLSNSLISFNGTQVQEEFLHPLHQCHPSHLLKWNGKANDGSSFDLQITTTPFGGCKDRISKFFKLFSFSFNLSF